MKNGADRTSNEIGRLDDREDCPKPDVSVVVVNWNQRKLTDSCIRSVHQGSDAYAVEVIVVDNGSSDGSVESLRKSPKVQKLVLNEKNLGFAKAVNQGVALSEGEFVLLLNNDARLDEGALDCAVDSLKTNPAIAVAGFKITYPDGAHQSSCFRFSSLRGLLSNALYLAQLFPASSVFNHERYGGGDFSDTTEVDCVMGGCMLIRRSDIGEEGLFDEGFFMYGEEEDFCKSLDQRGRRRVYLPAATAVHEHSASSRSPDLAAWAYEAKARAKMRFFVKWLPPSHARIANAICLLGLAPRIIGWAIQDLVNGSYSISALKKLRVVRFHLSLLIDYDEARAPFPPPPAVHSAND